MTHAKLPPKVGSVVTVRWPKAKRGFVATIFIENAFGHDFAGYSRQQGKGHVAFNRADIRRVHS